MWSWCRTVTYLSFLLLLSNSNEENIERGQTQSHKRDLTTADRQQVNITTACQQFKACKTRQRVHEKSHRDPFGINSGSEERRLPGIHIFLTLTGQLQLTIVLVNIPVRPKSKRSVTLFIFPWIKNDCSNYFPFRFIAILLHVYAYLYPTMESL